MPIETIPLPMKSRQEAQRFSNEMLYDERIQTSCGQCSELVVPTTYTTINGSDAMVDFD